MHLKGGVGGGVERPPLPTKTPKFISFTSERLLSASNGEKVSSKAQGDQQRPPGRHGETLAAEGAFGIVFFSRQEAAGRGTDSPRDFPAPQGHVGIPGTREHVLREDLAAPGRGLTAKPKLGKSSRDCHGRGGL